MTPLYFDLAPYLYIYAGECVNISSVIHSEKLVQIRSDFVERLKQWSRERNEREKVK